MKTVAFKIPLVFLCFISLPLCAQEMPTPAKQQNLENLGNDGYRGMIQTYDTRYEGVKGSPYFTEDWLEGKVELESGTSYTKVELLYNVYSDELIGRSKGRNPVIIDKQMVRSFTIIHSEDTAAFVKAGLLEHQFDGIDDHQYLQELYKAEVSLYAINKKKLNKASFQGAYNTGKKYDEFISLQTDYYFVTTEGEVYKFKPNKRSLLKVMKQEKEAVSNYMEDQSLDLNELDDLVKLVMYYESLLN